MIYSYPTEIEVDETGDDLMEVWVIVTHAEAYRPATRYSPAEGGVYDWYLARKNWGEYDEDLNENRGNKDRDLISMQMEEELNHYYGE